ncbi:MAG: JAB domain-containing protein [Oscillospiraceae bacterium]|jgi:DNA repair protein RadC
MAEHSHNGHRNRLKERFRKEGLDNFDPHNILELLLFYSTVQKDTNELAHLLMDEFGSLSNVFDASFEDLERIPGIKSHTSTLIKLIPALFRVYEEDRSKPGAILDTAEKAFRYLLPKFIGRTEEVVFVVCLDSTCEVKCCEIVNHGTVSSAAVNIRRIAELAMRYNATSVLISHNHPHGLAVASDEDIMTTDAIGYALKLLGIQLTDHIIIARDKYVSLAEIGVVK